MGRISTSSIYLIDIIERDPLSLGSWWGVNSEKLENLRYFTLTMGDQILMKFDI